MGTQILGYIYMSKTSVPSCSTDNVLFVPKEYNINQKFESQHSDLVKPDVTEI
jgi:hypothetical protein